MTFKYKLSRRLALLKDRRVLSLAVVLAAAVANCERPVATGVGDGLAQLVVFPPTVNVVENQSADFAAFGLSSAGDTMAVAVSWSVTGGGSISDSTTSKGMHYGHYKAGSQAGRYKVVATDPGTGLSDSATAVVMATAVPVAQVAVLPTSATASVGGTVQFVAIPLDSTGTALGGRAITWASSNSSVASVDGSGLATGVTAGSATITATSAGHGAGRPGDHLGELQQLRGERGRQRPGDGRDGRIGDDHGDERRAQRLRYPHR